VSLGLERTGRIVTAAAALLAITFLAFGTADVTFLNLFGVGLALAVLMDATVIRGLLVPAFMRLAGPRTGGVQLPYGGSTGDSASVNGPIPWCPTTQPALSSRPARQPGLRSARRSQSGGPGMHGDPARTRRLADVPRHHPVEPKQSVSMRGSG